MKRILLLVLTGLMIGCNKESDVNPASGTFIRYFGSENNNDAVLAIEAPEGGHNGFVLLSNIEIQISATEVVNKIKVTRTNSNGDEIPIQRDTTIYPKIGNNQISMKGASLIPLPTGYLIVGEWIKKGKTSRLLVLETDFEGILTDSVTISGKDLTPPPGEPDFYSNASLSGRAVIANEDHTSYIVLAKVSNSPDDMLVAEISADALQLSWDRKYRGNARNEVVNRIFEANDRLFWSATVGGTDEKKDIRIVEAPLNSESTVTADPVVVSPASDEIAYDFCRMIGGWAVIGSTNVSGNADIYLLRTSTSGAFISQRTNVAYGQDDLINQSITDPKLNDEGNSITAANDGNLVLLGTVDTPDNQKELFLMKINAATSFGMWRRTYGGGDNEVGASVRALRDGSYLVFGTTYFGRSRKLMLMKLNSEGEL